ncbi:uncharacterized protein BDR25DRAFT_348476 [Lindgomyces ingoldianus]|uniref:Uncharacterized protein n=1 Tax=Lindgomyces ingoldianus TaxID=673940 RepID=A0ACB6RHH7_9PLEO|nr:uncharacterized protein BDR25DRAFT_348476 [Lindgomyces ingoldianus]KAF2478223.1 hypothetical protein BDR25DRAFT_348476 [Lindgomyces ingoldianus]
MSSGLCQKFNIAEYILRNKYLSLWETGQVRITRNHYGTLFEAFNLPDQVDHAAHQLATSKRAVQRNMRCIWLLQNTSTEHLWTCAESVNAIPRERLVVDFVWKRRANRDRFDRLRIMTLEIAFFWLLFSRLSYMEIIAGAYACCRLHRESHVTSVFHSIISHNTEYNQGEYIPALNFHVILHVRKDGAVSGTFSALEGLRFSELRAPQLSQKKKNIFSNDESPNLEFLAKITSKISGNSHGIRLSISGTWAAKFNWLWYFKYLSMATSTPGIDSSNCSGQHLAPTQDSTTCLESTLVGTSFRKCRASHTMTSFWIDQSHLTSYAHGSNLSASLQLSDCNQLVILFVKQNGARKLSMDFSGPFPNRKSTPSHLNNKHLDSDQCARSLIQYLNPTQFSRLRYPKRKAAKICRFLFWVNGLAYIFCIAHPENLLFHRTE